MPFWKMNHKRYLSLALVFIVLSTFSGPSLSASTQAGPSGCVDCHTDESSLKALYVPPKIEASKGTG